jgi:hypothetical protein
MVGAFGPDDRAEPDAVHALRWPAGFSPGCSDVWARSELAINAPPAVVFSRLVTAGGWERDFPGIRNVRVLTRGHEDLAEDTAFEFEMNGLRLSAQVSDFAAGRRLAWSGQGIDISTYHAWVISGGSSRSYALAGFAARGAAAIALRETGPGAAQRALDRWAADLKAAAEGTRP